jgi:hypothetical protein
MVRVNIHIDVDSLIRDNREWLRFPARVLARPPLHVQNIIAWRQHSTIISVRVRSNPRDFFLSVPAQDEQWIINIVFRRHRRRLFIAEIEGPGRKNLQMSLHDARRHSITRCSTTGEPQKDAPDNQIREEHKLPRAASRRGRFSLPRLGKAKPYGSCRRQAPRPCVAAYRIRAVGSIVSP